MTPAQLDAAQAVREELALMFARLGQLVVIEGQLEAFSKTLELPTVNGDLLAKLSAANIAASEAMDAYDEQVAAAALKVAA